MEQYYLNDHTGRTYFLLPDGWEVVNMTVQKPVKAECTISQMVADALSSPIGTPSLAALVKGKNKIVVIVDDNARPTPKMALLTPFFEYLYGCGVEKSRIEIVVAVGTHPIASRKEIEETFGELSKEVRIVSHDCHAPDLVSVGTLKAGGDLKINALVAHADFRIAVGSILPHPLAGFGGGAKTLFPGVVGYETIRNHHIALMLAEGSSTGNSAETNKFLGEVREAGRLAMLDFIVDAVYDADEDVKGVVAGNFEEAHKVGIELCRKELAVLYSQFADVTIMSSFPYTDGPQVLKPLGTSNMITRKGGTVILLADRIKGGAFAPALLEVFDRAFAMAAGNPKKFVMDHIHAKKPIIPGIPMDFNSALNCTMLYVSRNRMLLVSDDADKTQAARLGFEYASSLQEAIDRTAKEVPTGTVNILPSAGYVLPVIPDGMKESWND
jgi:lactate racemase